jgi:Na+/H+ antiporter NhaD/arsenite permease-like protein
LHTPSRKEKSRAEVDYQKIKVQKSKINKTMNLELLFKILAVVCIAVAAFFLWRGNQDGIFVSAVLGAVCFFLSVRFQIKERVNRRDAETQRELEKKTD